jgi:hypothetical protein
MTSQDTMQGKDANMHTILSILKYVNSNHKTATAFLNATMPISLTGKIFVDANNLATYIKQQNVSIKNISYDKHNNISIWLNSDIAKCIRITLDYSTLTDQCACTYINLRAIIKYHAPNKVDRIITLNTHNIADYV